VVQAALDSHNASTEEALDHLLKQVTSVEKENMPRKVSNHNPLHYCSELIMYLGGYIRIIEYVQGEAQGNNPRLEHERVGFMTTSIMHIRIMTLLDIELFPTRTFARCEGLLADYLQTLAYDCVKDNPFSTSQLSRRAWKPHLPISKAQTSSDSTMPILSARFASTAALRERVSSLFPRLRQA
jgi:hypothetical protein